MIDRKAELLTRLESALSKVPHGVINSTWNKSVAYKDWVVGVRKVIKKGRASEAQLQGLINSYHNF